MRHRDWRYHRYRRPLYHYQGISSLWGGVAVLGVGVIMLLDRLGIIPARDIFQFWPMLVVAGGLTLLIRATGLTGRLMGGSLVGAGLLVQASYLGFFTMRGDVFWPFILIALGVLMLGRAIEGRTSPPPPPPEVPPDAEAESTPIYHGGEDDMQMGGARVRSSVIFSSMERRVTVQNFESARVGAVFGEFVLDLRQAGIDDPEARVKAEAVFGSIEVLVPENWEVVLRGEGVFGAVNDETRHPDPGLPHIKRLIIRAAAVFGSIRIANVPHR